VISARANDNNLGLLFKAAIIMVVMAVSLFPSRCFSRGRFLPKSTPAFIDSNHFVLVGTETNSETGAEQRFAAVVDVRPDQRRATVTYLENLVLWDLVNSPSSGLLAARFQPGADSIPRGSAALMGISLEISSGQVLALMENSSSQVLPQGVSLPLSISGGENEYHLTQYALSKTSLVYQAGGMLWIRDLAVDAVSAPLFAVTDPDFLFSSPRFLPGGDGVVFLAYRMGQVSLMLWQRHEEAIRTLAAFDHLEEWEVPSPWTDVLGERLRSFAVHPLSGEITYSAPGGLYVVSPESPPSTRKIVTCEQGWLFDPAWSSDGRYLAYSHLFKDGQSRISLYEAEPDRTRVVSGQGPRCFNPVWSPGGRYLVWLDFLYVEALMERGFVPRILELADDGHNPVFLTDEDYFLRGDILLEEGRIKEAGICYREYAGETLAALGHDRLLLWARHLDRAGMTEQAIDVYEAFLETGGGGPGSLLYILMRLASLSVTLRRMDAARLYYVQLLVEDIPRSVAVKVAEQALKNLGKRGFPQLVSDFLSLRSAGSVDLPFIRKGVELLLRLNDPEQAVARVLSFSTALQEPWQKLELSYEMVTLFKRAGYSDIVLELLESRSVEQGDDLAVVLMSLGQINLDRRRIREGVASYEKALELLGYPGKLVVSAARIFSRLGEDSRALLLLSTAESELAKTGVFDYDCSLMKANLLLDLGRENKGKKLLEGLISRVPERREAYLALADYYLQKQHPAKALDIADRILARFGRKPSLVLKRVKALILLERFEEARNQLFGVLPQVNEKSRSDLQPLIDFLQQQAREN